MADLNVALILRLVDRLSAPARAAARALRGIATEEQGIAKASGAAAAGVDKVVAGSAALSKVATGAAKGMGTLQVSASLTTKGMGVLGGAWRAMGEQQAAGARTAADAARGQSALASSVDRTSRSADAGARRFNMFERAQFRAAAASRALRGANERLERQLTTLAKAALVTEGFDRAGHVLGHMVGHSVSEAGAFAGGMTGFGITAELSDAQMAPIRAAIMDAARRYAMMPEAALETFASTRRSGVFITPSAIVAAGNEAARFQKLAQRMGSPVEGAEAAGGASSAVREYGFAATPAGLRRFFGMIDAAEKTGGGMTISDLLQYSRSSGGTMKALGFGNATGLADVLAGQQLSMFLAHSGGQAGINFEDLLGQIILPFTRRRFAKHGVDLYAQIKAGELQGVSPIATLARITQDLTHGDAGKIGELFHNKQAITAMVALLQNLDKFRSYSAQITGAGVVGVYDRDVARATTGPTAAMERWQVAKARLAVATGTILLPAAERLAGSLERIVGWITKLQERGGVLGKLGTFAIAAAAGVAIGAAAIGHLVVGVLGPLLIMRTLLGSIIPLTAELGKARMLGSLGGLAAGARGLLAGPLMAGALRVGVAGIGETIAAAVGLTGIGALIAGAAALIVMHWRGVLTFFQGFGRGFMRALAPLRPVFAPFVTWISGAARVVGGAIGGIAGKIGAMFGAIWRWLGPKPGEDWSKWGEAVGGAIGNVVTWIATLIGWIATAAGKAASFWAVMQGRGPAAAMAAALAAAGSAQAAPPAPSRPTPPVSAPAAGAGRPPGAPGAGAAPSRASAAAHHTTIVVNGAGDPRAVAREVVRQQQQARARANHDGATG